MSVLVTGNQVFQYTNVAGLDISQGDGTNAKLNATVRGNTIGSPSEDLGGTYGVNVTAGITSTPNMGGAQDAGTMCLDLGGAGADANLLTGSGSGGFNDIYLLQRFGAKFDLPGFVLPRSDATAALYLQSRNVAPDTVVETTPPDSGYVTPSASCPVP